MASNIATLLNKILDSILSALERAGIIEIEYEEVEN